MTFWSDHADDMRDATYAEEFVRVSREMKERQAGRCGECGERLSQCCCDGER